MIKRGKKSYMILLLIAMLSSVINPNYAFAAATDRSHFVVQTTTSSSDPFSGGYMAAVTQKIDSGWSTSSSWKFALRSLWLHVNGASSSTWIEVGYMDGAHMSYNGRYTGYYAAIGNANTGQYREWTIIGPSTAIGTSHTYQITYLGSNTYAVVVDGKVYGTVANCSPGGTWVKVGLETNNSSAVFDTSSTTNHQMKKYSNGIWSVWPSGNIEIADIFNIGYKVSWITKPT